MYYVCLLGVVLLFGTGNGGYSWGELGSVSPLNYDTLSEDINYSGSISLYFDTFVVGASLYKNEMTGRSGTCQKINIEYLSISALICF